MASFSWKEGLGILLYSWSPLPVICLLPDFQGNVTSQPLPSHLLHHGGLYPLTTVSQNSPFSLKLLLSEYFFFIETGKVTKTRVCAK